MRRRTIYYISVQDAFYYKGKDAGGGRWFPMGERAESFTYCSSVTRVKTKKLAESACEAIFKYMPEAVITVERYRITQAYRRGNKARCVTYLARNT